MSILFLVVSCFSAVTAAFLRPQFICFNKATPRAGGWDPSIPSSFTQASIDAILASVNDTRGTSTRRLCVSLNLWTMYAADTPTALASLDVLLALVEANDLPLSISIDPTQWWTTVPHLWNWWDPSSPGYDPANVANVEWSAPSAANATDISWRNWGSQFRMPTPSPNFASPVFRAAAVVSMTPLAARLGQWYAGLGSRRYLLAYVRPTQELWIGTNYFFYPKGNQYLPLPPADDPRGGVAASTQLGFAAVCGGGGSGPPSACSGATPHLTPALLDDVVSSFLLLATSVLTEAGIPRSRIITHTGAFWGNGPAPSIAFNTPLAGVTRAASPGWSLYGAATHARDTAGLSAALDAVDGAPWGAPEWLAAFTAGQPQSVWAAALDGTLSYRNNRLIVVQNWESVEGDAGALEAFVNALGTPPPCLVDIADALMSVRVNASAWALSWMPGTGADAQRVMASTRGDVVPSGALAMADVADLQVGGGVREVVVRAAGAFWWTVVSRGCGGVQSVAADVVRVLSAARY